jgi:hypothetical protein
MTPTRPVRRQVPIQTQTSFFELEYISKKKLTRRERFLAQIDAVG